VPTYRDYCQLNVSELHRHSRVGKALAREIVGTRNETASRSKTTEVADVEFSSSDDGRERGDMNVVSNPAFQPPVKNNEIINENVISETMFSPLITITDGKIREFFPTLAKSNSVIGAYHFRFF